MDVKNKFLSLEPQTWDFISRLEPKVGLVEHMHDGRVYGDLMSIIQDCKKNNEGVVSGEDGHNTFSGHLYQIRAARKTKIAIVGSGPSGLFAALVLAELGADVTLIERGQAVEKLVLWLFVEFYKERAISALGRVVQELELWKKSRMAKKETIVKLQQKIQSLQAGKGKA